MKLSALLVSPARVLASVSNVIDARDAFFFGGVAAICYGAHLIYPPAAWIIGGGVSVAVGKLTGRRG